MKATLISDIDVIPMTKYEYNKTMKNVAHLEHKWVYGFYIPCIHTWLSEDNFHEFFIIINED